VGEVLTLAVIAIFIVADMNHEWIWRVTLALGAVPAAIILYMRHDLPETRSGWCVVVASWKPRRSRWRCMATRLICCRTMT